MGKQSVLRNLSGRRKKTGEIKISSHQVKQYLADKYELPSQNEIIEFAVTEDDGDFERGVYKIRAFGRGEVVAKVIHKQENLANEYFNEIQNTHLAWQNDSSLGPYILKVKIRSHKPDFQCASELLFLEFEVANETLAQRLKKRNRYTESDRHENLTTLLKALAHLHQRGDEVGRNFHGDIKPDNLFIVQHRNADGQSTDSLKIGDIEETLGTLPYRDFTTSSCRGWETGDLATTEKKDDLMAVKMILLEMAYDFDLFEFCSKLSAMGKNHLQDFLESDALKRKQIIQKEIGNQKYLKSLPVEKALIGETMANLLHVLKELYDKVENVQQNVDWLRKIKESGYWKNRLVQVVMVLGVIAGSALAIADFGKALYIKFPFIYHLTHAADGAVVFPIGLSLLVGLLGFPKDKPNRVDGKIKFGNAAIDVGIAFSVLVIILVLFIFVGDLGSYRGNSYFKNYRSYMEEKKDPEQEIPGVAIDYDKECVNGQKDCFFYGSYQNDGYKLTLTLNNETVPADRLTRDFVTVNQPLLEKLLKTKLSKIKDTYGYKSLEVFKRQLNQYNTIASGETALDDRRFTGFIVNIEPDIEVKNILVFLHYLDSRWGDAGKKIKQKMLDEIKRSFDTNQ